MVLVTPTSRCARPHQANYFFDGPNQELNSRRVVLRVRTYDVDKKATVTLKVRPLEGRLRRVHGRGVGARYRRRLER